MRIRDCVIAVLIMCVVWGRASGADRAGPSALTPDLWSGDWADARRAIASRAMEVDLYPITEGLQYGYLIREAYCRLLTGVMLEDHRELARSRALLRRAAELDSSDPQIPLLLGQCDMFAGLYDSALAALRRVPLTSECAAEAQLALAFVLGQMSTGQVMEVPPTSQPSPWPATRDDRAAMLRDAHRALETAERLEPGEPDVLYVRAVLERHGNLLRGQPRMSPEVQALYKAYLDKARVTPFNGRWLRTAIAQLDDEGSGAIPPALRDAMDELEARIRPSLQLRRAIAVTASNRPAQMLRALLDMQRTAGALTAAVLRDEGEFEATFVGQTPEEVWKAGFGASARDILMPSSFKAIRDAGDALPAVKLFGKLTSARNLGSPEEARMPRWNSAARAVVEQRIRRAMEDGKWIATLAVNEAVQSAVPCTTVDCTIEYLSAETTGIGALLVDVRNALVPLPCNATELTFRRDEGGYRLNVTLRVFFRSPVKDDANRK